MPTAVVNICADPRLRHEDIRSQIHEKLTTLGLQADRVFITNEPGANIGSSVRGTVDMLVSVQDPVVLLGVLYHTDCVADSLGLRQTLDANLRELHGIALAHGLSCPILGGDVDSVSQAVAWSGES